MSDTNTMATKKRPCERLGTFEHGHLYRILYKLSPVVATKHAQSEWGSTPLIQHISKYSSNLIDSAHYQVVDDYRRAGGKHKVTQGRGRYIGSTNRTDTVKALSDLDEIFTTEENKTIVTDYTDVSGTVTENKAIENKATITTSELSEVITNILSQVLIPWDNSNRADHDKFKKDLSSLDQRQSNSHAETNNYATETRSIIDRVKAELEAKIEANKPTIVTLKRTELADVELGLQHKCFPHLLKLISARKRNGYGLNAWVAGPAGTGKSQAAENIATALGLPFYTRGALTAPHEVLGYCDAHSNYVSTEFRKVWEHGGVFCLDEVDASDPRAVLALNGALAGTICAFADKNVRRHKDCVVIATANTFGHGATQEYSGRYKQDAAAMDRWVVVEWPLDEALEASICGNAEWLAYVRKIRASVAKHGQKVMVTTRAALDGEALLAAGLDWDVVVNMTIKKGLSDAQWKILQS